MKKNEKFSFEKNGLVVVLLNLFALSCFAQSTDLNCLENDYDCKIAQYTKIINSKPDDAEAYLRRGAVYFVKRKYDRAIKDYDKAIELKPNYAAAYNNRAAAYKNNKDYEKALADYNKAIELSPS